MSFFIFLLLGIIIGGIIGWFLHASVTTNQSDSQLSELKTQFAKELERRTRAEAELNAFKSMQQKNNEQMKEFMNSFASQAILNNNDNFIKLARQAFDNYLIRMNETSEKQSISFENLIKPVKETLDKHENLVKEIQANSNRTYGNLQTYLEELTKSQKLLEKETNSLVSALKSPKVRGRWGEIGLRRLVEFSGMTAYCEFQEQVSIDTENGKLRPDLIIHLPDDKHIVIDSKVPLNAYLDAIESSNEEERKIFLGKHSKAVSQHVKDLSSKAYWSQFNNAIDFVVLYIEVEPAFGAAVIENRDLIEEGMKNRIIFATPTTLITLLQTVGYTWKQHKATENALEIWELSKELYERLATFSEYLQKMSGNIQNLVKSYNSAVGSWEGRVIPGIKRLEEKGVSSERKKIEELVPVELIPRELA
jgi:DNA recombination protein RmuC